MPISSNINMESLQRIIHELDSIFSGVARFEIEAIDANSSIFHLIMNDFACVCFLALAKKFDSYDHFINSDEAQINLKFYLNLPSKPNIDPYRL